MKFSERFNPLNRGGDIHTTSCGSVAKAALASFNPLNRGGDIHTTIGIMPDGETDAKFQSS